MAEIDDIEAIYREYGNDILRMSYLYLKDKHLAEDALQETFVRVIRFYSKFNHKSSIKTWVTQIAINVCKDMLRSRTSEVLDYEDRAVDIADERGNAGFDDVGRSDTTHLDETTAYNRKYFAVKEKKNSKAGLGGSSIKIGEFVNSIINFLIIAFVLFVVIKFVNSLHKKPEEPAEPEEPTTKVCPYCQSEISIKAVRCPHCTSKLEGFPEMKA